MFYANCTVSLTLDFLLTSVFQFCGSVQMFAAVLFSIGLLAYPAGWGSGRIKDICGKEK